MQIEAEKRLMRKREVATYLGVSERMVDKMLSMRQLTPIKFGTAVRVDRAELDRKIEAAMVK